MCGYMQGRSAATLAARMGAKRLTCCRSMFTLLHASFLLACEAVLDSDISSGIAVCKQEI
jgi:hypothetical protein